MKKIFSFVLPLFALFLLSNCGTPDHYPKNPNYHINKPAVKYTPSKKSLDKMVKKLQGSPYVWAEEGPNNFDCSGFTYYLYGSMGIEIPRVARKQALHGKKVSVKDLQYGDLIFFATSRSNRKKITHVGMYLGDGWFTHASTIKHEIIYTNLFASKYYKNKLRVCRRYLPKTQEKVAVKPTPKPAELWKTAEPKPTILEPLPMLPIAKKKTSSKKAIVIQAPLNDIEQSSSQGHFYVQVGSFVGKPNMPILSKIKRHGFTYKIIHFNRGKDRISKLLIGPYAQRKEANKVLVNIRNTIQRDAFIAEIR